MTTLFAQPYDLAAVGFYFANAEEYATKAAVLRNDYGQPVEEFEIQFIDGEDMDYALAEAWGLNQVNLRRFLDVVEDWDEQQKLRFIIAVGECGYAFDLQDGDPDEFDVDIYETETMRELAEQFVEEGLFGDIAEHLAAYIDYDAIARDLAMDYAETTIAGRHLIYRCG